LNAAFFEEPYQRPWETSGQFYKFY